MSFVPKSIHFCISEAKKKSGKECCAYNCKNSPIYKKRGLCHKHYQRYRRIIDPVYDRYHNFKHNALRRCKEFTITLEEFRKFCIDTGYLSKGKRGYRCTIDRIDNSIGYRIDNIQLLSNEMNIQKYHEVDKLLTEENNEEILF